MLKSAENVSLDVFLQRINKASKNPSRTYYIYWLTVQILCVLKDAVSAKKVWDKKTCAHVIGTCFLLTPNRIRGDRKRLPKAFINMDVFTDRITMSYIAMPYYLSVLKPDWDKEFLARTRALDNLIQLAYSHARKFEDIDYGAFELESLRIEYEG